MMAPGEADLDSTYEHLITLWTSGVRDYHTMLSDYLTANSIFVAVIGLIVSRESPALSFTVLIVLLCVFGILLCLQMAIVLGRLSGQNALWEWRLRGIEQDPEWHEEKLMTSLRRPHEIRQPIEVSEQSPCQSLRAHLNTVLEEAVARFGVPRLRGKWRHSPGTA